MAMTSTLTQVAPAMMGQPTTFTLAIANGGASTVNVYSIQPQFRRQNGGEFRGYNLGKIEAPPNLSSPAVGGYQFNVPVTASGTVYFSFQASLYGPSLGGGPTQPQMILYADALCSYSDATSSGCLSPILVNINQPQYGQAAGVSSVVGQLDFQNPLNSNLALLLFA